MSCSSAPSGTAPGAGLSADVRDAIRGVRRDYTTGTIGRAVVLLAIPMVLEMSMSSLFAVFDNFFVGRLGPEHGTGRLRRIEYCSNPVEQPRRRLIRSDRDPNDAGDSILFCSSAF